MTKQLLTLIWLIVLCLIGRLFYEKKTQDLSSSTLVLDSVDYVPSDTTDSKSVDEKLQASENFLTTSKKIGYRYYENKGNIYFENDVVYWSSFEDRFTKKNEYSLYRNDYEVIYCFDDSRMCIYRFWKKYYIDQVEIDLDEGSFTNYSPDELLWWHSVVSSLQWTYYLIPWLETQVDYIWAYSNSLIFLEPNIVINSDYAYSAWKIIDGFDASDYSLQESDSDDLYRKYTSNGKIFESNKVLGNWDNIPWALVLVSISNNTWVSGTSSEVWTQNSWLREQPVVLKTQDPNTQRVILGASLGYQITRPDSGFLWDDAYDKFVSPNLQNFETMVSKSKTKPIPNNNSWIYMDDSKNSGGYVFYETLEEDSFELNGLMPWHIQAVEVIWEGDNKSYFLTSFDAANSNRFTYRVSKKFGNITPWKNMYLIRGYWKSDGVWYLGHEIFERIISVEYYSSELKKLNSILLEENQEVPQEDYCIKPFLRRTTWWYLLQPTRSESQESVFDLGDVQVSIWWAGEWWELNTVQFSTTDSSVTTEIPVWCGSFSWMNVNRINDEYLEIVAWWWFEWVSKRYLYKIGSDRIENIYEDILLPNVWTKAYRLFTIEGIEENVMTILEHRYCCDTIENPGWFERYEIDLESKKLISVNLIFPWSSERVATEDLIFIERITKVEWELYRKSRDDYNTFGIYTVIREYDGEEYQERIVNEFNKWWKSKWGVVLNPSFFDTHPTFWKLRNDPETQDRNQRLQSLSYEADIYEDQLWKVFINFLKLNSMR